MAFDDVLKRYELLVQQADRAFDDIQGRYPECVECRLHCSDCCHAVFGVFIVEAVYLQRYFSQLKEEQRQEALERARQADRDLEEIQKRMAEYKDNPDLSALALSRERMACPLLDRNEECILYPRRPLTCRVYGIPTAIRGKSHVCDKAHFKDGETYPTFDLDAAYKALHQLSKDLLQEAGKENLEKASYLLSVSKAIGTPIEELID
jgi:Fe-S-cluster containining protein